MPKIDAYKFKRAFSETSYFWWNVAGRGCKVAGKPSRVGHIWTTFCDTSLGFESAVDNSIGPGQVRYTDDALYEQVSARIPIPLLQLSWHDWLARGISTPRPYNLLGYNCVQYAYDAVVAATGIIPPFKLIPAKNIAPMAEFATDLWRLLGISMPVFSNEVSYIDNFTINLKELKYETRNLNP